MSCDDQKTTCPRAVSLASVLFQQYDHICEGVYVYIRDQYIQESNDGEVLLIFWKGCTMLKPEIAQVPLVINIRQTLIRGLPWSISLEQSWISLGLRNPN